MNTVLKTFIFVLFILHGTAQVKAQSQVKIHSHSAEALLSWMNHNKPLSEINRIKKLPGSQIMEQLMLQQNNKAIAFNEILTEFAEKDSIPDNQYLLNEVFKNRNDLKKILSTVKKSDLLGKTYQRAIQYFPDNYAPSENFDLFFTLTGWKWGDAMTFHYVKKGDRYLVADTGKPAMLFNLTLAHKNYGNSLDQQIKTLQDVMAHELFHALFSGYNKENWEARQMNKLSFATLKLMLNEGMAHYIAEKEKLDKNYYKNQKLRDKEKEAFKVLSDQAEFMFNPEIDPEKRKKRILKGTYGKYWGKYICIPPMFMAFHIEQQLGIKKIKECIKNGPVFFIFSYQKIQAENHELPSIPDELKDITNN
jgi:hypothetical protein